MEQEFAHRTNPDGTFDSIRLKCFVTIATTRQEADLEDAERNHVCDPTIAETFRPIAPKNQG